MIVLYIVIAIIAIALITALFVSKDMSYEKSIVIKSPIEKTWDNVSSLGAMDKWSPWKDRDPNMKQTLTGTDGESGAISSLGEQCKKCWCRKPNDYKYRISLLYSKQN